MKTVNLLAVALMAGGLSAADLAQWVDPFVGTSATGHTFPAACVPLGMVQAGPDTGTESWHYCSGYRFEDQEICGFSQDHLNGTGCSDLGDVLIAPFEGKSRKAEEVATPGYYAVSFPDAAVKVEATVTEHVGFYRMTSLNNGTIRLWVDGQWGLVGTGLASYVLEEQIAQDGASSLSGTRTTRHWDLRKTAFTLQANREIVKVTTLPKRNSAEKGERYVLDFAAGEGPLEVKVALSRTSVEAAKANLAAEIPGWDFDGVKAAARAKWNKIFELATVEGSDDQKKNFYTALYHLYIQPNNIADVGQKPFYSTFSCWDTFRAAHPLYTILTPNKAADFVDSMLEQGKITGYLPIWTLWGEDNQCMIGTHSVPVIVDWFLKNPESRPREYWLAAFAQIKDSLTKPHPGRVKENWDLLDKYGYYPFDLIRGESVSRTLECAYDDACAARMAEKLGLKEDAAFFAKRAGNWKNVFDPSLKVVRGKDSQGNWRTPFNPYRFGHGAENANDFTEGNAGQYTWHVMQDAPGLIEAMGGKEAFTKKLDAIFEAPCKAPDEQKEDILLDITGLIGQYVHGNEPSHHILYFYPQVGHPEKAAERIREVFDTFYLPKPDGLCGNDDCGQMSAWYVFSAMGFYPFDPCGGEYILGAPQIPEATLHLANGKTFKMVAHNLSKENKYVKSITLNGKLVTGTTLTHEQIMAGGELVFEMIGAYGTLPTQAHLDYHAREIISIVHWGPNTFVDQEWGFGNTPPSVVTPDALDPEQWVVAMKAGGIKGVVLVSKHHDGFNLWPSELNKDYSMAAVPGKWKNFNVVKAVSDACHKYGLDFGIYISPWDRHQANYATPAYVDYFHAQWEDIMTHYGPISEIWLDGANGGTGWYGGVNGDKGERRSISGEYYRRPELQARLHQLHPRAVTFGGGYNWSLNWCGTEAGFSPKTWWNPGHGGDGKPYWFPSEADTPFRTGWFYHEHEKPKSFDHLVNTYFETVGRGAVLNFGIAPDKHGLVCADDVQRLKEFGDFVRQYNAVDFAAVPGAEQAEKMEGNTLTQVVKLPQPATFNSVDLREKIALGQRVQSFTVEALVDGAWKKLAEETTVGARRIVRFPKVTTSAVRVTLVGVAPPAIQPIALRLAPDVMPAFATVKDGLPKAGWKVLEESLNNPWSGANILDGNTKTLWCTHPPDHAPYPPPQFVAVDCQEPVTMHGFDYVPRMDGCKDGLIDAYEFAVSNDGKNWTLVKAGEFGNMDANPTRTRVTFDKPVTARYFKITGTHSLARNDECVIAEIDLW